LNHLFSADVRLREIDHFVHAPLNTALGPDKRFSHLLNFNAEQARRLKPLSVRVMRKHPAAAFFFAARSMR
jgi:hypothetical protein